MRHLAVVILVVIVVLLVSTESDAWGRRRRRRRRRVNCGYNNWGRWSRCNAACYRGTQYRRRYIYRWPCCGGWGCPSTYTWRYCGSYNGGCQQRCTGNGYCSCYTGYYKSGSRCYDVNECSSSRPCNQYCYNTVGSYYCRCYYGYYLATRTRCDRVSCGAPRIPNCPSSSYRDQFGTTCNKVYIPSCGKLYRDYCYPRCSSSNYRLATYSGGGAFLSDYSRVKFESVSRVQCQGNKIWTDASRLSRLYCRRINDPPSNLHISSYSINENTAVGSTVASFSSSDPQSGQSHTYTLRPGTTNTGYYLFRISGNRLLNRWVPKLNVPGGITHTSFKITVRTTDNGRPNMYREEPFTIRIINVNDPPQDIKLSPWQVKEDVSLSTYVGTLSAYDPDIPSDSNPCASWILRDSDNGFFKISGNRIYTAKLLNHEAQSFHSITVICTDKQRGSLSTSQTLVIDVQDAKDPPISVTIDSSKVDENSAVGKVIGTVTALDEDDESLTISLYPTSNQFYLSPTGCVDVQTSTHIHRKSCTAKLMVKSATLNWEQRSWYGLTLYARDSSASHLHKTLWINVTINNLNEAPTAISIATPTIAENSPGGSQISDLDVSDPDNEVQLIQRPTCVLAAGGDNPLFEIEGQSPNYDLALAKGTVLDYEKRNKYSITVTCNDHGLPPMSITRTFTISVTDVNEPPDGITLSVSMVPENSKIGTVVGTFSTSDPDTTPQVFTYKLLPTGGSALPFKISGTRLVVNGSIDYEMEDSYELSVAVTDQGGEEFITVIDLNVTDIPEGPTSVTLDGSHTLPENSAEGTLAGNIIVVDQDFNQFPTCVISKDYTNGALEVAGVGGDELVAGKRMVDYETEGKTPLKVDVTCSDPDGLSKTSTFNVMITDENEAPTNITIDSDTVPENTAPYLVGQLSVIDPDAGQTHNCSVQDNDGAAGAGQVPESKIFKITKTNQLEVISPLDYEGGLNTFSVHVLCSDIPTNPNQTSYVIERDIPIYVVNVNEKPGSPCDNVNWHISEAAKSGTPVTSTLTANDTEADQVLTFSLANAGSVPFYINASSMAVFTSGGLDYETNKYYDLQIKVTDDGTLDQVAAGAATSTAVASATYTCRVNVLDANDPHASIDIVATPTKPVVDEHLRAGSLVATLSTTDVDANAKFTYTIVPSDGPFEVVKNQLVARAKAETQLDWESGIKSVALSVTSTDEHGWSVSRPLTIYVRNVNENATKMCLVGNTVKENIPGVSTIGQIIVQDPDLPIRTCGPPPAPHTELPTNYTCKIDDNTLTGIYTALFEVSPTLQLQQKQPLDYETEKTYNVPIFCSDKLAPFNTITSRFTVNVIDVNEAPRNIQPLASGQNMPYNATQSTITIAVPERQADINLLTLTCADPDYPGASPQVMYTATGNGVPTFMEMQNNRLYLLKPFDFETQKQFVLNVQVTDDGKPPPALTTSIKIVINVQDTNDLPTQINLVCQNGAQFPFDNTTKRPSGPVWSGAGATSMENITTPTWPGTIITHPGIAGSAEDCSIIKAGTTMPGGVIGEVYPQDQDAHKWYTFSLLGDNAKPFTLYPYGMMRNNKYTHSALILLRQDVDMYTLTYNNPTYNIYVDVYDNFGMQQIGHIVHLKTYDACYFGKSQCQDRTTCMPSKTTIGQVTCGCPRGSVGDGLLTSLGGSGCTPCGAGELPNAQGKCEQVNECASNPCMNGVCVDGTFKFTCTCKIGFSGTLCETNLEGCTQNTDICNNGGSCVDTAGALGCACQPGYTGKHCEYYAAACSDFPASCDSKHAAYCALTPHVGQLESSALCIENLDIIHIVITGVPAVDVTSVSFYHVCSGFIDEILASESFALTFNHYASSQLGLTSSRRRRDTTYTKLADKPFLTQTLNVTAIRSRPGWVVASFAVVSKASNYALKNAYSICPKFDPHSDIHCVHANDCAILESAQFRCSATPFSQLPVDVQNDPVHYIQTYDQQTYVKPPCKEGASRVAGDCSTDPVGPEGQGTTYTATSDPFYKTTLGIVVMVIGGVALIIIIVVVVYFSRTRKNIKSRYVDQRLIDDDNLSTHSGVSGVSGPSVQQSGRNFTGVRNPLFEGGDKPTEQRENAMYDSAGGGEMVDNNMYDGMDGQQLYEELPN